MDSFIASPLKHEITVARNRFVGSKRHRASRCPDELNHGCKPQVKLDVR
jgi:hypothetical protein